MGVLASDHNFCILYSRASPIFNRFHFKGISSDIAAFQKRYADGKSVKKNVMVIAYDFSWELEWRSCSTVIFSNWTEIKYLEWNAANHSRVERSLTLNFTNFPIKNIVSQESSIFSAGFTKEIAWNVRFQARAFYTIDLVLPEE